MFLTYLRLLIGVALIFTSMFCMEYVRIGTNKERVMWAQWVGLSCSFAAGVIIHYALL